MAGAPPRALVLVTSRSFGSGVADPEDYLAEAGLEVVRGDSTHDVDALAPLLAEARGWIAGAAPIGDHHLAAAPRLRVVSRYGTGTDAVDLDAAARCGIIVTNTPGANADAVAEHTLALLLSCLRHVVEGDRAVRAGDFPRLVGRELSSLSVGLVGLGRVGRAVAARLRLLGAHVLGHDPVVGADDAPEHVTWLPLDDLLARCDVVSLHCPGGGPPVLDRDRLARLRPGTVMINTARADVVDEDALADLLTQGRIAAAAVDTPSGPDSPLLTAPRTILTPHIGGHTVEAIDRMSMTAAEEVVRVLVEHRPPRHPVTG